MSERVRRSPCRSIRRPIHDEDTMLSERHCQQYGRDLGHVQPEVVDEHPETEREEDLLPGAVQDIEQVVVAIVTAPHDRVSLGSHPPLPALVEVREAEDRDRPHEGDRSQDDERGPERQQVVVEDDEDHHQRGEGPGLIERRHPAEDAAALRLGGQAQAERELSLQHRVEPQAADDHPRHDRPEAVREAVERVADSQKGRAPPRSRAAGRCDRGAR